MDNILTEEDKQSLLQQYKEITNVEDDELATATLASLDWNLASAIEQQFNNESHVNHDVHMEDIENIPVEEPEVRIPNPRANIVPATESINDEEVNAVLDNARNVVKEFRTASRGIERNSSDDDDLAAPSRTRNHLTQRGTNYRRKIPVNATEGTDDANTPNGISDKATSSYASRAPKATSSSATSSRAQPVVLDSDEDDGHEEPYVYYSDDDTQIETNSNRNRDRLPLIPTDFYSIEEALQNFNAVFESRYGVNHPPFLVCPFQEALSLAFDNQDILARSPLAVYLHHDDSVASNIFVAQVLCNNDVAQLLKRQFVNWAWDMTQEENRSKLIDWLAMLNMGDLADMLRNNATDRYPLLVVLTKDRGSIMPLMVCRGHDSPTMVIQNLMHALDEYQRIKNRDSSEEQERLERDRVMREQHDEYQRSLEVDRAKEEERKRQQQLAIEEEEKRQREIEENEIKKAQLASSLPEEPADGGNIITIRLRLPTGEFKIRRFKDTDQIRWLPTYAESLGYDMQNYRLWNSAVPKEDISSFDHSKTFVELKWPKREQIVVEEKL